MKDPNIDAEKGDILWGENNKNKDGRRSHYMVYLKPHSSDSDLFIGAMITHAKGYGNILLKPSHFEVVDQNGNNYQVIDEHTLIVAYPLIKKVEWFPFHKAGKLSPEGIAFIENAILHLNPEFYADNL
jgi:hypothetical protein